jgi:hypothetical protein
LQWTSGLSGGAAVRLRVKSSDAACICSIDIGNLTSGTSPASRNVGAPVPSHVPPNKGDLGDFPWSLLRLRRSAVFVDECSVPSTSDSTNVSIPLPSCTTEVSPGEITGPRPGMEVDHSNSICLVRTSEAICRTNPEVCSGNIMVCARSCSILWTVKIPMTAFLNVRREL